MSYVRWGWLLLLLCALYVGVACSDHQGPEDLEDISFGGATGQPEGGAGAAGDNFRRNPDIIIPAP